MSSREKPKLGDCRRSSSRLAWAPLKAEIFAGFLVLVFCVDSISLSLRSAEAVDSQAPIFITNAPPRDFMEESLTNALNQRLTPEEVALVVNPLANTPEMSRYAHELTSGATNDWQRAR